MGGEVMLGVNRGDSNEDNKLVGEDGEGEGEQK